MSLVIQPFSSAAVVRDLVAAGDRRRRQRAVTRMLSRAVPVATAAVLVVALLGAALGWPVAVTAAAWLACATALSVWAFIRTRSRPTTDAIAVLVDEDAGLSGELRSAHWFAVHPAESSWATYHLDEAAKRSSAVAWSEVYPRAHARGSWLAAGVLSVAAFAVPLGLPSGSWLPVSVPADAEQLVDFVELEGLSPELRDKLLELLAAVREGKMTPLEAMAALRELTDFASVDPSMKEQIAELLEDALTSRDQFERLNASKPVDAGKTASDVEWARENMTSRLASEEAQKAENASAKRDAESSDPSDSQQPGPTTEQSADGEAGEASEGQPGAKLPAKPSESADGASVMMLGNASSAVGEPGSVFGGKRGNIRYGTSQASEIAASLKRETVEAIVNIDKSDPDQQDRRRKTQQSWSALTYTRGGGRASFDRARSDAVRAVPEARKPVVERYFVRPATAASTEEQTNR